MRDRRKDSVRIVKYRGRLNLAKENETRFEGGASANYWSGKNVSHHEELILRIMAAHCGNRFASSF
jgi:hypothetical protein